MTNPSLDLEELKRLAAEATPGPWSYLFSTLVTYGKQHENKAFALAAVNSLPALIAEVERLRAERVT